MDKKKGMLFGRLNVIDLAVLLVLLAAVAFFGMKFMATGSFSEPPQKVRMVFFEEECADYVADMTKVGDPAIDGTGKNNMGVVTDILKDDSITYDLDTKTGNIIMGSKEGYVSVYITTEAEGVLTDNGVVIDDVLYSVGHSMVLHAGYGKYYLSVYSIEAID